MILYLKLMSVVAAFALAFFVVKTLQSYAVIKQQYAAQQTVINNLKKQQEVSNRISGEAQEKINHVKFEGNTYAKKIGDDGFIDDGKFDAWLRAYEFNTSGKTADSSKPA